MRSEAIFRFGEFTFDSGSRLLVLGETRRHLSPKAQQLLHLLLEARPRALSRQDLYDALWPSTFVCETNLASIVNEVRRALGDDARASQYIRTVHGFGYAFGAEVALTVPIPVKVQAILMCGETKYRLYMGENLIGRAPDARVVLPDRTISRHHATITILDGENTCFIKDLESKNGTYVDGEKIGSKPVLVTDRAQIGFGATVASVKFRRISSTAAFRLNLPELKRQVAEQIGETV